LAKIIETAGDFVPRHQITLLQEKFASEFVRSKHMVSREIDFRQPETRSFQNIGFQHRGLRWTQYNMSTS
jgi:hypothetical protein